MTRSFSRYGIGSSGGGGVKKSMSFSNFGSVRAGADNALQVSCATSVHRFLFEILSS